ncbi:MAG: ABC transporter permease subunit/CPBP intramembrane protease [Planctomycetota bacterium]|nr:ABC transporter permease subunit/CPBP intramembrane protease [Planctomycetota bacterium]
MNWKNIKFIFHRELRDQLRDRRTLFTIAVLPLLLYPLLGTAFLQMANFSREHPSKVAVLGVSNLPEGNPLVEGFKINESRAKSRQLQQVDLEHLEWDSVWQKAIASEESQEKGNHTADTGYSMRTLLVREGIDCLVVIPAGFAQEMRGKQQTEIQIFSRASDDKSRMAASRIENVLRKYRDGMAANNLRKRSVTSAEIQPFRVSKIDLSSDVSKRAVVWSRVLSFVVFIWALTGAFYPAIDLCAGEKERGTLETLLSSPASRTDIVWGKLLTVIAFSMGTSILNLFSLSFTGLFVINSLARMSEGTLEIGPPPFMAFGWLVLALIPLSAFFGATSLAIASFARSTKEGQYYLMPILLICLPLMMLPMMPGAELDLGTSLVPVSGLMLVLRALIENRFSEALQFVAPALAIILFCCLLVIKWAVSQFNNEKVLFRESERLGIGAVCRSLLRERGPLPTFLEAIFCGVLLLVIRFFTTLVAQPPASFEHFARQTLVLHLGMIVAPVILMAMVLTTRPLRSLGLSRTRWSALPLAVFMAIGLHPIVSGFGEIVLRVYPLQSDYSATQEMMEQVFAGAPHFIAILLLFALLPAISEELAFRGFIMNGLKQVGDRWTAILIASFFFGATHGILQQSIIAFFTGSIIGFVSFQAGSILPAVCYHFTHNAITVSLAQTSVAELQSYRWTSLIFQAGDAGQVSYQLSAYFLLSAIGIGIFVWFYRMNLPNPSASDRCIEDALVKVHQAVPNALVGDR